MIELSSILKNYSDVFNLKNFRTLGQDIAETFRYLATFWNAVNLKYIGFSYPEVKILITGIIIAKVLIFSIIVQKK